MTHDTVLRRTPDPSFVGIPSFKHAEAIVFVAFVVEEAGPSGTRGIQAELDVCIESHGEVSATYDDSIFFRVDPGVFDNILVGKLGETMAVRLMVEEQTPGIAFFLKAETAVRETGPVVCAVHRIRQESRAGILVLIDHHDRKGLVQVADGLAGVFPDGFFLPHRRPIRTRH